VLALYIMMKCILLKELYIKGISSTNHNIKVYYFQVKDANFREDLDWKDHHS